MLGGIGLHARRRASKPSSPISGWWTLANLAMSSCRVTVWGFRDPLGCLTSSRVLGHQRFSSAPDIARRLFFRLRTLDTSIMHLLGIMYIKYSSYLLSFSLSRKKIYIYKGGGGLKEMDEWTQWTLFSKVPLDHLPGHTFRNCVNCVNSSISLYPLIFPPFSYIIVYLNSS